jgi:co-chaperonin GroES (HSP10)
MSQMNLIAVNDKIVVKPIEVSNTTKGGIIMPENSQKESFLRGKVISIGKDVEEIKIDDILAFHPHAGMDIMTKNREIFKVVKYGDVFCVIQEQEQETEEMDDKQLDMVDYLNGIEIQNKAVQ